MKVFFIAGEPSGDLLGGRLIAALKQQAGQSLTLCGVGGPRMCEQGLQSLFPMSDLTLFGLAELLPKIPLILRRLRETEAAIRAAQPDLVVTIDAPDFCFRIAKKFKGSGIKFVHYVAPTVWAWRPGRAKKIQPWYQHLLALFPFEPPYFERVGLPCTFVGHPLVEAGIEAAQARRFRQTYNVHDSQDILVVLPGSRRSELASLLPVFRDVVANLLKANPALRVVIPTLPHLIERLKQETVSWPGVPIFTTADSDKYDAFKAGKVALAASGTIALELALAGLPAVIAYKVHPLTYALYHRLITVKYANLVNIMADKLIVPEFLQTNCTAGRLAQGLTDLLSQPALLAQQREALARVSAQLKPTDSSLPSARAAQCLLGLIK
jgi:lipid-A-disaccharide synthase